MHDDLFDFFYEALPGYEQVGCRRDPARLLGRLPRPRRLRLRLQGHDRVGPARCTSPRASSSTASWSPPTWSTSTSASGSCSVSSYYDDWDGPGDVRHAATRSATRSTARHPWNQHTHPEAAEARLRRQVQLGRCRRAGSTAPTTSPSTPAAARSPACGRRRWPAWSTSATSRRPATASRSTCRRPRSSPRWSFEWKIPQWSQRDRARPRPHLLPGLRRAPARCTSSRRRWPRSAPAAPRPGRRSRCPTRRIGCGFTEAVRGVLSHHMVIRDGKIANYHPYPPTPWNANPRDSYGTPGPVRGRGAEHADLRGERPGQLQGHRHHARGAQLRPVPAVRRAHVPRQRQDRWSSCTRRPSPLTGEQRMARRPQDRTEPGRRAVAHGGRPDRARCSTQSQPARTRSRGSAPRSWSALVTELYGGGLERIARRRRRPRTIRDARASGSPPTTWSPACCWSTACTRYDVERRVSSALDSVRPYLGSHGGDVELLGVDDERASACGCRAAATAARRRRSRWSWRSRRRSEAAAPEIIVDRSRGGASRVRAPSADPGRVAR